MTATSPKLILCRNCALSLARLACDRDRLFRWSRSTVVLGMRGLGALHGIDPKAHPVKKGECHGCLRFLKGGLEEKSPLFRWLNGLFGRRFSEWRDRRATIAELAEAKRFAGEAMGSS